MFREARHWCFQTLARILSVLASRASISPVTTRSMLRSNRVAPRTVDMWCVQVLTAETTPQAVPDHGATRWSWRHSLHNSSRLFSAIVCDRAVISAFSGAYSSRKRCQRSVETCSAVSRWTCSLKASAVLWMILSASRTALILPREWRECLILTRPS